jgi:death-on-curing protein
MTPRWVSRKAIDAIHSRNLAEHGGASGVRDEGMQESALARPEQLANYGEPDIFDLAAAYAFGIVKNHPFVDGNKRTAFGAAYFFLRKNGYTLRATEVSVVEKTLGLAASAVSEKQYADWLRENSEAG